MDDNIFVAVEATVTAAGRGLWAAQAPFEPTAGCDVKLIPRVRNWRVDADARRALAEIRGAWWVDGVATTSGGLAVRFADRALSGVAERVNGSASYGRHTTARAPTAIYFWGANTTKALHVGHLRDLAVGNSLSAALSAAGLLVERRSLLSDMGRGMGEAMSGVAGDCPGSDARLPPGEKGDHYVGRCYAKYVASGSASTDDTRDSDSLERETMLVSDGADVILARLRAGDPAASELWLTMREWVVSGHQETLRRLGVAFDRVIFESDFEQEMVDLSAIGLASGVLDRREDGVVVYATNHEELEEMPLVRSDGLPTQHMRALAYWATAPDLEDMESMQVCGSEWVAHVTCRRKLMRDLACSVPELEQRHPARTLFHGMVHSGGRRLASSQSAPRIDDVIAWIDARVESDASCRAVRAALPRPDSLAGQVALGYFLLYPMGRSLELDLEGFLREGQSLGWDLARARAHAANGIANSCDPLEDLDFRFALVQSELMRHQLRHVVERYDVLPLARQAWHFARWCVRRPRSRAVCSLVDRALDSAGSDLGLGLGR
jgi:tRNA synthetases class I (R)